MAITVRRPRPAPRAKITSQQPGRTPGMESQQPGRTPSAPAGGTQNKYRPGVIDARPTNSITPNRSGINPAGVAALRKKLFRSY